MFTLTIEKALEIQAQQCAYYEKFHPGITELVREATDIGKFETGVEYSVVEINRYVPRGGKIEQMLGLCDGGGN